MNVNATKNVRITDDHGIDVFTVNAKHLMGTCLEVDKAVDDVDFDESEDFDAVLEEAIADVRTNGVRAEPGATVDFSINKWMDVEDWQDAFESFQG